MRKELALNPKPHRILAHSCQHESRSPKPEQARPRWGGAPRPKPLALQRQNERKIIKERDTLGFSPLHSLSLTGVIIGGTTISIKDCFGIRGNIPRDTHTHTRKDIQTGSPDAREKAALGACNKRSCNVRLLERANSQGRAAVLTSGFRV